MPEYYLDFETQGTNPEEHKIITIQFQRVDTKTGKPREDLTILKEWESSEEDILEHFLTLMTPERLWNFIPVGFNLKFEFFFLYQRVKKVLNRDIDLKWLYYDLPQLDLKYTLVMMNNGEFRKTTLDWFVKKQMDHSMIPMWYDEESYDRIENYIVDETKRFFHAYQFLKSKLPELTKAYHPLS
ncbi:MAG: ribonuclease H-like domain-containing protein [Candidatus Thorarchaeota archaeon]